jgi:hypothetical protein
MIDNSKSKKGVRRPGSGRTKGAFSFCVLTLADLTAKFNDPTQKVTVGRVWAEQCGFEGLTATSAKNTNDKIDGTTPATAVIATVTELD